MCSEKWWEKEYLHHLQNSCATGEWAHFCAQESIAYCVQRAHIHTNFPMCRESDRFQTELFYTYVDVLLPWLFFFLNPFF